MSMFGDGLTDELYELMQRFVEERGLKALLVALGRILTWIGE